MDTFLEQYKTYVEDLGNLGTRHADTTKFFVSLLSALVVFQSVAGQITGARTHLLAVAGSAAGILICALWGLTAHSYSKLYQAKLGVIRDLETHLSHPCYADEYRTLEELRFTPISKYEKLTSFLMGSLFVVVGAATVFQLLGGH